MDKFFKLTEKGTDVRTEVLAGLTTFFAMSYILFVNPAMLAQTGMPKQGGCRNLDDGFLCQLALCAGTGHGVECLFHFYGRLCLGLHLAGSLGYGLYLRDYFAHYHFDQGA